MSTPPPGPPPSEEELRAAYEEQIKQIRVEDILMENVVTLINLGMRRSGLMSGTEPERDPEQVRVAVESVRALLPVIETIVPEQMNAIRQALSQLQLAYVRIGGQPHPEPGAAASGSGQAAPEGASTSDTGQAPAPAGGPAAPSTGPGAPPAPGAKPGDAGPAQRSGRLWIPGQ